MHFAKLQCKLGPKLTLHTQPSWMVHRHDLHTALYERAVSAEGPGRPVRVRLGARVTTCDPEAGSLVTEDGTTHTADLLIGADGIKVGHSPACVELKP